MPLPDPLPLALFADLLPVASIRMDLDETAEMSRTAAGAVLSSDRGDRLWMGEVELDVMEAREADLAHARLNLLRGGARRFEVYDTRRPAPRHDPSGALLGAANPVLGALPAGDFRLLSLAGLPGGYRLAVGDYLAYDYAGGRRALHVVQEDVVAGAGGSTAAFEVLPWRRRAAVAGLAVRLVRAGCIAKVEPGSTQIGASRHTLVRGTRFGFRQDLR